MWSWFKKSLCIKTTTNNNDSNSQDINQSDVTSFSSLIDPLQVSKKELREAFDAADKNRDGNLSPKEMEAFLKERGVKIPKVASIKNKLIPHGKMNFEQFYRKIQKTMKKTGQTTNKMDAYKEIFKFLDENGDGLITKTEIRERMKLCGQNLTDQQVDQMMRMGDKNNDEHIDFQEFIQLMGVLTEKNTSSSEGSDTDCSFEQPSDKKI